MDNKKAIDFLEKLSSHQVYKSPYIVHELNNCGFAAEEMVKNNGIIVNGLRVESTMPEWGEPGIYSLHLLSAVFQLLLHEPPVSEMQGRGFWFRDVLGQLKTRLGMASAREEL